MVVNLGIVMAFGVALCKGFKNIYQKKNILATDEYVTSWAIRAAPLLVLTPVLLATGIPDIAPEFYRALAISGAINVVATFLIAKGYKHAEVSLVAPLFALSPALMLITSPLIVGEFPSHIGLIGVVLITIGTFFLKAREPGQQLYEPLVAISRNRGAQCIFIVVVLYSISSNFDKIGVQAASPAMWAFSLHVLVTMVLFPVMVVNSSEWHATIKQEYKPLVVMGILGGIGILLQTTALTETLVMYVISIKRLSIPLSVVLGYWLFDESNLRGRLGGSVLMVLGAILISIT